MVRVSECDPEREETMHTSFDCSTRVGITSVPLVRELLTANVSARQDVLYDNCSEVCSQIG
jgi:hypothetical protein